MVYNDSGVWRNLQNQSEPWAINWDFRYSRFWKKMEIEDSSKTQQNAQPCSYVELDIRFHAQLEARVEEIARSILCSIKKHCFNIPSITPSYVQSIEKRW